MQLTIKDRGGTSRGILYSISSKGELNLEKTEAVAEKGISEEAGGRGWSNSTAGMVLDLHVANPALII